MHGRMQPGEDGGRATAHSESLLGAGGKVKRSFRQDKLDWLDNKSQEAQRKALYCIGRDLYCIVRDLAGVKSRLQAPVKDKNGKLVLTKEQKDA